LATTIVNHCLLMSMHLLFTELVFIFSHEKALLISLIKFVINICNAYYNACVYVVCPVALVFFYHCIFFEGSSMIIVCSVFLILCLVQGL